MSIRVHNAIEALKEVLAADTTVSQQATEGVYAHRLPVPPTQAYWSRVVVRMLKGLELTERDGFLLLPLQVMVEVKGAASVDLLLEATHERIRTVLEGARLATEYGLNLLPNERLTRPSAALYDEANESYLSTATYLIPLKPTS